MSTLKPIDAREIVKENAALYRDTEETRQRKEDMNHFIAQNPVDEQAEKILETLTN